MTDVMFETLVRLTRLAGMERACSNDSIPGKIRNGNDYIFCPECKGSGQVYLFPNEVRVACQGGCLSGRNPVAGSIQILSVNGTYHLLNCLGWNPSPDLEVWSVNVWKLHERFTISALQHISWSTFGGLGDFSVALEEAVKGIKEAKA